MIIRPLFQLSALFLALGYLSAFADSKNPVLEHISAVSPDVLAIEIHSGHVTPGHLEKYVKQAGDVTHEKKMDDGRIESINLVRGGKDLGWLIGLNRDWLATRSDFEGDPLQESVSGDRNNYAVHSTDDPNFKNPIHPLSVGRIDTPTLWGEESNNFEMRYTLYLKLPQALTLGKNYLIDLGELNLQPKEVSFAFDPSSLRSESVHVNQIGYRTDDPAKRAFFSCWMGTGGGLKLPENLNFSLVDDKTGKDVWHGQSHDLWPADKQEQMQRTANFSGTDVMRLDFSDFNTPGRYRVVVEGVDCSYPFDIGRDVWKQALWVQMKGLYNQRSGMKLGPPHTDFEKERDMHPGDPGVSVTWTKARAVERGAFDHLASQDTGEPALGWGGYDDAGDWNPRRVTHMAVTLAQLELLDLFPAYFEAMKLNIPPTNGVPDILTEAIFEFETFHRLQRPDGGVGYGLETMGDPVPGEVSWLQSYKVYALTPDYYDSWYYATVGARLSFLLRKYDSSLAATYRQSAIAAFNFAEKDFANDQPAIKAENRDISNAIDQRNFAALELYRLTGDEKWHDIFLENTVLKQSDTDLEKNGHAQRDQAFLYAHLPDGMGDSALKVKATACVKIMAQRALDYAAQNAFNLTTSDPGKPQFIGFYSAPDATDLAHAHFLTNDPKYLVGLVQATQFSSGDNPNNIVYTSGLGANPVKYPFKIDARRTGQAMPIGLTPYGNVDLKKWGNQQWIIWPITYFISKNAVPNPYDWPVNQAYWDIGGWPALNEFTVDSWAPNITVWGYLAARN
jgi:endoglucanase